MHSANSKRKFTIAIIVILTTSIATLHAQSDLSNSFQDKVTPDSRPNWIKFKDLNFSKDQVLELINQDLPADSKTELVLINRRQTQTNSHLNHYVQRYRGLPIEHYDWLIHEKQNKVFLAQGHQVIAPLDKDPKPIVPESSALEFALDGINAEKYAWEIPALETAIKITQNDTTASHFPKGNLIWVSTDYAQPLELAYRFEVYAVSPFKKSFIYINAKNGRQIKSIQTNHEGCFEHSEHCTHNRKSKKLTELPTTNYTTATAEYIVLESGEVTIPSSESDDQFILMADNLGPNENQIVHTLNANQNSDFSNLTDFFDEDNTWSQHPVPVAAHWGAIQSYDYFLDHFDRNSFDDQGTQITNIVHYGTDITNAFWDGSHLIFGDGDGFNWGPLTSLDIIAHEYMHGITQHNGLGGLIYKNESGALNESFSDIFGTVIEFNKHPDGGDWTIGEDFDLAQNEGFRNMQDPHLQEHPKAYLGQFWHDGESDKGGVHTNSSIQNHWFYLISNGGSGINQYGFEYDISPIGMDTAAQICYHNLTHYLTPNSSFQDAYDGSLLSTTELFGEIDSNLVMYNNIMEAWCAVGLGSGCAPHIDITSPSLDEEVPGGMTYNINWNTNLISPTTILKLEYLVGTPADPFAVWEFIVEGEINDGNYVWEVPNHNDTIVSIRIIDQGDPTNARVANKDIVGISENFILTPCLPTNTLEAVNNSLVDSLVVIESTATGINLQWTIDDQLVSTDSTLIHLFETEGVYDIGLSIVDTVQGCIHTESSDHHVLGLNSSSFNIEVADYSNYIAHSQDIIATKDGGYLFSTVFPAMVFKFDPFGNMEWKSEILPSPSFGNYKIMIKELANSNALVVMGLSETDLSNANDQILFIEIDGIDGSIVENTSKRIGLPSGRLLPKQIIERDSSFIIGGTYKHQDEQSIFFVEVDKLNFEIDNQHWFGNDALKDYYGDIIPTSEGGYLLGWIQSGQGSSHYTIAKLDSDFNLSWQQGITPSGVVTGLKSRINFIELPNCGGFMVMTSPNASSYSSLIKLNLFGNVLWGKKFLANYDTGDQLICFHKMIDDQQNGVTLLGSNRLNVNANSYPEKVDYQLANIDYQGNIKWNRKVKSSNTVMPSTVNYNLFAMDIENTYEGGYIFALPQFTGAQTKIMKVDNKGIDGCAMTQSQIEVEDISSSFNVNLDIITLSEDSLTITGNIDYAFEEGEVPIVSESPFCGNIGNDLIASYKLESKTIFLGTTPEVIDLSRGSTGHHWELNGEEIPYPFADFNTLGEHELTLVSTDSIQTSTESKIINVIDSTSCTLECDMVLDFHYFQNTSCPSSADAFINSQVNSAIGRTFDYFLYNDQDSLLATQATGYFPNLNAGSYLISVKSHNDQQCYLDLDTIVISQSIDTTPPKAVCISAVVNAAFVHGSNGLPYDHPNYITEMNAIFGTNWHKLNYSAVDPSKLFSDSYNYIHLEGSDKNANELEEFLLDNQSLIEEWVYAGNSIFINAAPTEGDGLTLGFGEVALIRNIYHSANTDDSSHPIFNSPYQIDSAAFSGTVARGALLIPDSIEHTVILKSDLENPLLVNINWGSGKAYLGSLNLTAYYTPVSDGEKLRKNIHSYLSSLSIPTINSPFPIEVIQGDTIQLELTDIDLGSFDDCQLDGLSLDVQEITCENEGIIDVMLTASDASGNTASCVTKMEVNTIIEEQLIQDTICLGEQYYFNDAYIEQPGTYELYVDNAGLCNDSITILELVVAFCGDCPDDHLVINETPIEPGDYVAYQTIESSGTGSQDTIKFMAQDSILMMAGFSIEIGTEFTAKLVSFSCPE